MELGLSHRYDPAVLLYSPRKGIFQQEETRADSFGVQGTSARALPLALGLQQKSEVEGVCRSTDVYSSRRNGSVPLVSLWFCCPLNSVSSHCLTKPRSRGAISLVPPQRLIVTSISITALPAGTSWGVSEH